MIRPVTLTGRTVRRISSIGGALLVVASGIVITAQGAYAATPISCNDSSLISAITTANAAVGGGTVTLPAGCTFTLTAANNTLEGDNGLPVITNAVTIDGNGAKITRGSGAPDFRFFFVDNVRPGGNLTLNSLTLSNGATTVTTEGHGGGAILNRSRLSVTNVTFLDNVDLISGSAGGGAIDNHDSGQATISKSTFISNRAEEGGAVEDEATVPGAFLNISQSTFSDNAATMFGGGGVENQPGGNGTLTADTFVGNTALEGGGVANGGTMTVTNSTLVGNTESSNGGGGIQNYGTITLQQTTLSGNRGPGGGADLHTYVPSGTTVTTTVTQSIVANGVTSANCSGSGAITDGGYNLDSGTSCGFSAANNSLSNTQPQLEALASNGGPTQTMALPAASPAVDAIPASVTGCTGSADQRGVSRPEGAGCDIGAYEVIVTSGDTQPPSQPTGLAAPSVTANAVTLTWNPSSDNVAVTGYTVYRNGSAVGSTGGAAATTFTDSTAAPATAYSYTVDAFDGSGNHSIRSAPLAVTTPAPSGIQFIQGDVAATATCVTQTTIPLTDAVGAGDLLVGWFGQYDASGDVQVSDNINGAWTRSASTTYSSGGGDIALYYVQNAAAAPYGVTVTIASSSATYLTGVAGDYEGTAATDALDQVVDASGNSTTADSGSTAPVSAGELVVGAILTGGSPGSVTPGASQGQPLTMRAQTGSGSADLDDVLSSAAGTQDAPATLGTATDWYAVVAVFHPFGGVAPAGTSTATVVDDSTTGSAWSGSEVSGASAEDTATVGPEQGSQVITGTVTYKFYSGNCSSGTLVSTQTVTMAGGLVPNSAATGALTAGSYAFQATYSGDANYSGSTAACEPFSVLSAAATLSTTPAPTTGKVGVKGTFGDTATVTGLGSATPTGTVKFILYQGATCTGAQLTSGKIALVAGKAPAAKASYSASWTPPKAGKYYWTAVYSGDANYTGSATTCAEAGELVTVSPSAATISTTPAPTTGKAGVKATFGDTATVTGLGGVTPTGTVKFILYQGSGCTGAQLTSGQIALVAGTAPVAKASYSASWTPPKTGNYYWTAVYSGNANYKGSATTCAETGDLVTVGSATTTKATAITHASSRRAPSAQSGPWETRQRSPESAV